MAAIAITASSSFARQTEVTLSTGQQTTFAGYVLRYDGMRLLQQPQRQVLVARISVFRDGRPDGGVTPSLNLYPGAGEPIGTPSIRWGAFKDLYASVLGFEGESGQRATFRFFLNPGVLWLWVGGAITAGGGIVAAGPDRRRSLAAPPPARRRELAEVG